MVEAIDETLMSAPCFGQSDVGCLGEVGRQGRGGRGLVFDPGAVASNQWFEPGTQVIG